MRSPAHAMLWEIWRVTRVEVAWKLVIGIVGGLLVLALCAAVAPAYDAKKHEAIMDFAAAFAMTLLVVPHWVSWLSVASLNGGRTGFPFYLQYSRPVRTAVIVGLPMAYLTAMSAAIYLVSALALRVTSGYAFPLLPVAAWIAGLTLVFIAATWTTRNKIFQMSVMAFAVMKGLGMAVNRITAVEIPDTFDWPPRLWPTLFDFPRTDYAWIALIGIASFGISVAGVMRQRRGQEGWAVLPSAQTGGLWVWLVNLFRFPCPTSSATRAQVWFDLKSNGLPLLTIGVALAIMIVLVSAVSGPIDAAINADPDVSCPIGECFYWRATPPLLAPISLLIVLFLGGNAFGIRQKLGRTYVSAFEATHPNGTPQLALLKVLVKSVCVLAAIIAIGVSVWISMPLLGDAVFIQMWNVPLSSRAAAIDGAVAELTGYEQLALAVVVGVGVVIWVAVFAVFGALRSRYSRRIVVPLLLIYGVALVWLAVVVGVDPETAARFHLDVVYGAMRWIAVAAMVFTTVYAFWTGFAERALTIRYVCGALVVLAAFGAAWLTLLAATGAQPAVPMLWPLLPALMATVLAPWALNRVRHT